MSRVRRQDSIKCCYLGSYECERSGLLVTFFMAWSPGRRFNAGDSRLLTQDAQRRDPPTAPNSLTEPKRVRTTTIRTDQANEKRLESPQSQTAPNLDR
jgi:hypothetical protein